MKRCTNGVAGRVNRDHEEEQDNEEDTGVGVVADESSLGSERGTEDELEETRRSWGVERGDQRTLIPPRVKIKRERVHYCEESNADEKAYRRRRRQRP